MIAAAGIAFASELAVLTSPVDADSLPELNQIVVSGSYAELETRLSDAKWSSENLGGALIAAAGTNQAAKAKLLIEHGAEVDFSVLFRTPLIVAAYEGASDAALILLEHGANPNYMSSFEWRPLHNAMRNGVSNDDIITLLLRHGADVDARTNLQVTPLHRAGGFCLKSAVLILLEHGASKSLFDKYGQTAAARADKAGCSDVADILR